VIFVPCDYADIEPYKAEGKANGGNAWLQQDWAKTRPAKTPIEWHKLLVNGEFAGCVGLLPKGRNKAAVRGWFVREQFRGQGLGIALLHYVSEEAKERGFTRLQMITRQMRIAKYMGGWRLVRHFKLEGAEFERDLVNG
jgi:GNAT superfamily N-acetyltransferase